MQAVQLLVAQATMEASVDVDVEALETAKSRVIDFDKKIRKLIWANNELIWPTNASCLCMLVNQIKFDDKDAERQVPRPDNAVGVRHIYRELSVGSSDKK